MTALIVTFILSLVLNGILIWYGIKVLSKLLYTSDNLGDLYVAFRMFERFCDSLYEMDMYHGEPVIKELIFKIKLIRGELERFEEIYGLTLDLESIDKEIDDEDGTEEEARQEA